MGAACCMATSTATHILHDGKGRALLGDFGAATRLGGLPAHQARALQQLEMRAFGCLLES